MFGGMIVLPLNVKEIESEQFGNCVQINYETMEILVTLDYGPRIISVRNNNGINPIYNEIDPTLEKNHGHKMRITLDKSTNGIYCDNSPVRYSPMAEGVRFVQTITEPVQLEVIMDVYFSEDGDLTVEHSVFNKSKEEVKLSIYTETPFISDGFVFIPQGTVITPERPSRIITLWDECKWSDSRLFIGDRYVTVHSDNNTGDVPRLKIGVNDTEGIVGFIGKKANFIKKYTHNRNALYPFYNCSAFATENNGYLSIQMTSPFYLIEPDEAARHIEVWKLTDNTFPCEYNNEDNIESHVQSM